MTFLANIFATTLSKHIFKLKSKSIFVSKLDILNYFLREKIHTMYVVCNASLQRYMLANIYILRTLIKRRAGPSIRSSISSQVYLLAMRFWGVRALVLVLWGLQGFAQSERLAISPVGRSYSEFRGGATNAVLDVWKMVHFATTPSLKKKQHWKDNNFSKVRQLFWYQNCLDLNCR